MTMNSQFDNRIDNISIIQNISYIVASIKVVSYHGWMKAWTVENGVCYYSLQFQKCVKWHTYKAVQQTGHFTTSDHMPQLWSLPAVSAQQMSWVIDDSSRASFGWLVPLPFLTRRF